MDIRITIILLQILIIVILGLYTISLRESFRLDRELTDKYLVVKEEELKAKYGQEAWDHCRVLMRVALRWSPDENEVPTLESKPFPCGNTVEKCLIAATETLSRGDSLEPFPEEKVKQGYAL